jgi:hypothetical protein
MDPITVLISALSLAGTAFKPVSDQAIKDGYAGFKALILRKFGDKSPDLEPTLAKYEEKPEVWKEPVRDMLQSAGADRDQEVLGRASELLKQAESAQPGITGGVVGQINAQGGRVVTITGDQTGTISMGDTMQINTSG